MAVPRVWLCVLAATSISTADATPAPAPEPIFQSRTREPDDVSRELGQQLLLLLNGARAEQGAAPLMPNPHLDLLAYQHSVEMAQRNQVSHYSNIYGIGTRQRLRLAFPEIERLGENVARNRDPETLHDGLMASPGHRRTRLDKDFHQVGMGLVQRGLYQVYMTEIFVSLPADQELGPPIVLYTDFRPGTFTRENSARAELEQNLISVPAPGSDNPEYWTHLGIEQFNDGDYERATAHFRRALALDPGYRYARFDLGRTLIRDDRPQEATEVLAVYLADYPEDAEAWRLAGTAAMLAEDFAAAEHAFRRPLLDRPRQAADWYNLGLSLEYQDRVDEASASYAQALALDPYLEEARDGLARVRP